MSRTATTSLPAAAEPVRRAYPRGFTIIDNRIITDFCPQIGIAGLALYAVLSKYADNVTRQCYPSIRTLSRRLGISQPTVLKAMQLLEVAGLVEVVRARSSRGQRHVNVYTLLPIPYGQAASSSIVNDVSHTSEDAKAALPSTGNHASDMQQGGIAALPPVLNDVEHPAKPALAELYSINNTQVNKRESESGQPAHALTSQENDAVKVYRDACGRTPNATQRAAISETVTDLSRWEEVIRQWVLSGFRKQNVAGMLDWYNQGIPQRGGNNPWSAAGRLLGFQGNRPGEWQPSTPKETPEERARFDAEWEALGREARERARALQEAANQTADG
jgi:DNA-binding Lrp family transcriptional regulator